jgi:quercetin dioxygenase-like cupin family protein
LLTFDISAVLTQLKQEETWQRGNRNAITLFKTPGLRVVVVALHAGTMIPSHRAEGPITVQVFEGRLTFSAGSKDVTFAPGQLLTLQPGIAHGLAAEDKCAFLPTIAGEKAHAARSEATAPLCMKR